MGKIIPRVLQFCDSMFCKSTLLTHTYTFYFQISWTAIYTKLPRKDLDSIYELE